MIQPTIYLMHGFIGSGKTTIARKLAQEKNATLLTHDDFMIQKYGRNPEDFSKERFDLIDEKIKKIASDEIKKGNSVIMDYGFWEKETRKKYFKWAKSLTPNVIFCSVQCDIELAKKRTLKRTTEDLTQFFINEEIFLDRLKRFEMMTEEEIQKERYQTEFYKSEEKEVNVFKINLFTYNLSSDDSLHSKEDYQKFCITHHILGWGWPHPNENFETLEEYKEKKKQQSLTRACNQIYPMKVGDFCWTRYNGDWYLGKVTGENFNFDLPQFEKDSYVAFGMYRACQWVKIEDEWSCCVPGNIVVYKRNNGTVCRIKGSDSFKKTFYSYCDFLYKKEKNVNEKLDFYTLAHSEDLEDIVGIYLQVAQKYCVYPSTNKMGTKDYEYELIHPKTKVRAIIQSKYQNTLNKENWEKFETGVYKDKEVFILIATGYDSVVKEKKAQEWEMGWQYQNGRIKIFDPNKLFCWIKKNASIMPLRIQKFLELS